MTMFKKSLLLAGAAALAINLAACTSAQEQAVLNAVNTTCASVGTGGQILIAVASSLDPSLAPVLNIVQTLTGNIAQQCSTIGDAVAAAISDINVLGGTATVQATTVAPTGVKHRYAAVFGPSGKVTVIHGPWVVPPY
jgi:hypothetical protein